MNVVVLSMVPQRDWLIDDLITSELVGRGHNAVLRNYLQDGRTAIIAEKPDVVIMPVVRCEYSRDFARRLKEWGVKVIARRSEAGVSKKTFQTMATHWKQDQLGRYQYKDLIDLELIWSQEFADILIDNGMIRSDQVRIIGGITLDPYFVLKIAEKKGEYDKIIKEPRMDWLQKRKLTPEKKTLLFCTGFINAEKDGYCLPEAPAGDPIHKELQDRDINLRNLWIETIRKLAKTKKYNIIIRPHHGEKQSVYDGIKGTLVSTLGDAVTNIYHCDCMIHAGSTMAVEAHYMDTPSFCLGSTAQDELIRDVSPYCPDANALKEGLESLEWGKSNALIDSLEDLQRHFYGPLDGKAYKRCADAVCEFDYDIQRTPPARQIPSVWPYDEYKDYSSPGVIKLTSDPIGVCGVCGKLYQNKSKQLMFPCPHCGIGVTHDTTKVKGA